MKSLDIKGYKKVTSSISKEALFLLDKVALAITKNSLADRKNIFSKHPEVMFLFDQVEADLKQSFAQCQRTPYCFYIEKNTEQNWPLPLHRDVNYPSYLKLSPQERKHWQKYGFWARVNLDSHTEGMGALLVVPQSHKGENSDESTISLPMRRGDVLFFHPMLLHGSAKMVQGGTRRVFQCFFLQKPFVV